MLDLHNLSTDIQRQVDEPWCRAELYADLSTWHKTWASLYVIGDTHDALVAYMEGLDADEHDGHTLLAVYGAFQALVVQQDAVQHIYRILRFPYKKHEELLRLRRVRVAVCGHPVESNEKDGRKYHTVTRADMSRRRFTLGSDTKNEGGGEWRDVSLPAMIALQNRLLGEDLAQLLTRLRAQHCKQLQEFQKEPMYDVLVTACPGIDALEDNRDEVVECLRQSWDALRKEFKRRGSDHMLGLHYLLEILEGTFAMPSHPNSNPAVLLSQIAELAEMCKEIDQGFSQKIEVLLSTNFKKQV